jgi:hypothetical protein
MEKQSNMYNKACNCGGTQYDIECGALQQYKEHGGKATIP